MRIRISRTIAATSIGDSASAAKAVSTSGPVVRDGARSDYGSLELNAPYPLSKLSGGDLTGWIMLQYFGGYGESLLDYREKLDSQLRLAIAVAL